MADEKETKTGETKTEVKEETKTGESTEVEEEKESKFNKEKLYGIGMVIGGIIIFAALAMLYGGFWDLFVKGIIFTIAIGAIGLIILGIVFALYA